MKWPVRYFSGLSPSMKSTRKKELLKRRRGQNLLICARECPDIIFERIFVFVCHL